MQNQSLKCADARHFTHLSVGDDTLSDEEQLLAEHLHTCSDCRAYHAGMVDAMHAIERVRDEDVVDAPSSSMWPGLADKLQSRKHVETQPERRRFNGSVVALCACSLMLALVSAIQVLPSNDSYNSFSGIPAAGAMNVNFDTSTGFNAPAASQRQLIRMTGPNGSIVLVDPATNQAFVPDFLKSLPADEGLQF